MTPREFLRSADFSPTKAHKLFPNARRLALGGLFISHSGIDYRRILDDIIPVVFDRLPADGYFLHNRASGGADSYRQLVQAALHWCDKFMVVISKHSLSNEWVHAEVEWAIEKSRPILVVKIDSSEWHHFRQKLGIPTIPSPLAEFDFNTNLEAEQLRLGMVLDELLRKLPRELKLDINDD